MMRGLKILFTLLLFAIAIGGAVFWVFWLKHPTKFPLKVVEIRSELIRVDPKEITAAMTPFMANGFFGLNVEVVQQKLNTIPWVSQASVRRLWPDRIVVQISEQTPQALWSNQKETVAGTGKEDITEKDVKGSLPVLGVLSTEGRIFYPDLANLPANLPRFIGSIERIKEIQQQYFASLEALAPLGLSITTLTLTKEGSFEIGLDNGITIILGKTALQERIARFVSVYPGLQTKSANIAYLDLRYTNGMAIGWKTKASLQ